MKVLHCTSRVGKLLKIFVSYSEIQRAFRTHASVMKGDGYRISGNVPLTLKWFVVLSYPFSFRCEMLDC